MSRSTNKLETIQKIFQLEMNIVLSHDECMLMEKLVLAFIDKNEFRFPVSIDLKEELLEKQNYSCNICHCLIDIHDHLDHIIPFKYVGDCLDNNFQMLCCHCNTKKGDKINIKNIKK
ncbi:MAG: HNH endonuclease signature motif containing protein [Bacillota bacterium]|nr:HNH endonuclease signature motif containing protein [Bacillota bacterium]